MDDYEVSKWEPDPISTPSATIQNAVLNPEETSVSKFSKPKTVVTVSVPTKIRHLWLAELSRLDDSHTVKSALQTLQQLSSAKKMPAERIAPFIALFAANHDHKVHRPFTRRACVQVITNLCMDRGSVLERHILRIANAICGYCGDDDPGVRRACAFAFDVLVKEVIAKLAGSTQPQALEAAISPVKKLIKTSHNPRVQDGAAMCLANLLDACEDMEDAEKISSKLIPILLKRLRRTKPTAKASVLNAISATVCRSSDLFVQYALDIVTALLHDIGNATDSTGGWQGKKCAIDILTQVGEATPLPLVVIEDVLTILEKLRFDKVPVVRDCVKDSLAVYDSALRIASKGQRERETKIGNKNAEINDNGQNELLKGVDYVENKKAINSNNRNFKKNRRVEKRMVGENTLDRAKQNNMVEESQNMLSAKEGDEESIKVKANDESANIVKRFSLQQKQLRRDFDFFREETRSHLTSIQKQVNSMETMLARLAASVNQITPQGLAKNNKIQKTIYRSYKTNYGQKFSGSDVLEVRPGRTEEVFEEALSNYEEREFVRFVGKFGVESLTKLSLATQKKTMLRMLEAMEEKKFVGQYIPWLEQTVNLGIQHQVFAGPGIYHRFVELLKKLHETKLLKRL